MIFGCSSMWTFRNNIVCLWGELVQGWKYETSTALISWSLESFF